MYTDHSIQFGFKQLHCLILWGGQGWLSSLFSCLLPLGPWFKFLPGHYVDWFFFVFSLSSLLLMQRLACLDKESLCFPCGQKTIMKQQ